jgi:hypothetical protein
MNKGDQYLKETLEWAPNAFGPGMFCSWDDDTDDYQKIPEPAALILGLSSGASLERARRHRRRARQT